jgi:two-component system, NarL family, response regulator NreC
MTAAADTRRRVLIVDDHEIVRHGLALMIAQEPDLVVAGLASDFASAAEFLRKEQFDVVVVDISLGGVSGLEIVKRIADRSPSTRVLVLTMHEESLYWERVMAAGAHGFVMKRDGPAQLIQGIRTVLGGAMYYSEQVQVRLAEIARSMRRNSPVGPLDSLSDREIDVLRLMGRGLGTTEIATRLNRSVKTIETHKANLKTKLGMGSAQELTGFAMRWAIDTGDESFGRPSEPPAE